MSDTTCATPDDTQTTDSSGSVTLTAPLTNPAPYFGYFQITDPSTPSSGSLVPQLVFPGPFGDDGPPLVNVATVSNGTLGVLGPAGGITIDQTKGDVIGAVYDCTGTGAAGVVISSNPAGTNVVYVSGGFPDPTATATASSGQFIIGNIAPTDTALVNGTVPGSTPLNVASDPVLIRAGTISTVVMLPQ